MAKITVGGIPWEELTEQDRERVRKGATDVVADMVTQQVQQMVDEGKSLEEIKKFLGLDKNYKN